MRWTVVAAGQSGNPSLQIIDNLLAVTKKCVIDFLGVFNIITAKFCLEEVPMKGLAALSSWSDSSAKWAANTGAACGASDKPAKPAPSSACGASDKPAKPAPSSACGASDKPANPAPSSACGAADKPAKR